MIEWISVEDRLPLEDGDYICTRYITNSVEVISFCAAEEGEPARWFDDPSFYGGMGFNYHGATTEQRERMKRFNRVTGWMPLPPPMESAK